MGDLISVKALKKRMADDYVFYGFRELFDDFIRLLDTQETVDAVPVEWMEQWKLNEDNDAYNRHTVDCLIRDWRKENGSD